MPAWLSTVASASDLADMSAEKGDKAATGGSARGSFFTSPRLLLSSTPRSLLSTPRSIISASSSAFSWQSERWAAAKAAKNELYEAHAHSVCKENLKLLSRGQLRYRLRELGSARSEGEGLSYNALVESVLLWNALALFKDDCPEEHVEALRILKEGGLSLDLLRKALLVTGVPLQELRGFTQQQAADLLHSRLSRHLSQRAITRRIAQVELEQQREAFQLWCAAGFTAMDAASGTSSPSRQRDEEQTQARDLKFNALDADLAGCLDEEAAAPCEPKHGPRPAQQQPGMAWPESPGGGMDEHGAPLSLPVCQVASGAALRGRDESALQGLGGASRDAKFDALDADLGACLGEEDEAVQPCGQALAGHQQERPRPPEPPWPRQPANLETSDDAPQVSAHVLGNAVDSFIGSSRKAPGSARRARPG